MAESLKKAAVAQFLEAIKNSLNHLSETKMAFADAGRRPSNLTERDVMQLYSRARRIREALRRWLSAYPTPESLSLPEEEQNLLVSCLVFELNRAENAANATQMTEGQDHASWFEKRKEILSYWAVELATRPIEQLPTLWTRSETTYEVRQVLVAVREKFSPSPKQQNASGIYRIGGDDSGRQRSSIADSVSSVPSTGNAELALVETARIRDYRLRLTMVLDLRAYERALIAEDYRLAAVMLSMVFEAVLVDHGLAHQSELGLSGAPKEWAFDKLTEAVFESEMTQKHHAAVRALLKSRDLLRPSMQFDQPMVVNKAMVQNPHRFVALVAKSVGVAPDSAGAFQ